MHTRKLPRHTSTRIAPTGRPWPGANGSDPRERLIVALDFPTADKAMELVERLDGCCRWFKVGMELYYAAGNRVIEGLRERGYEVFLDLKLHDIPNTVAGAVRSVAGVGASLLTVHAGGGEPMMRAAAQAASAPGAPKLLAVTVLTSMDEAELRAVGVGRWSCHAGAAAGAAGSCGGDRRAGLLGGGGGDGARSDGAGGATGGPRGSGLRARRDGATTRGAWPARPRPSGGARRCWWWDGRSRRRRTRHGSRRRSWRRLTAWSKRVGSYPIRGIGFDRRDDIVRVWQIK